METHTMMVPLPSDSTDQTTPPELKTDLWWVWLMGIALILYLLTK